MTERILYESPDILRSDTLNLIGTEENLIKIRTAFKEKYWNKPIGIFPAKRIILTKLSSVSVQGIDPVISCSPGPYTIERAAILVQKWGYGFYHFINEMFPKILRIAEYDPTIPIITFYNTNFIKELLDYAGVTNPIIEYDGQKPCRIKDALHITDTASGNPMPDDIERIRDRLRIKNIGKRDTIIMIYRGESNRSIQNFFELRDALKARFPQQKWVIFDKMPLEHTIRLFQGAKLIIGAHGAGLSNMIFAPRGTPIIELSPANMFNACFWHLSWILGNTHTLVASETIGPSNSMIGDIDRVSTLVQSILHDGNPGGITISANTDKPRPEPQ
jgi:hypothetical protein